MRTNARGGAEHARVRPAGSGRAHVFVQAHRGYSSRYPEQTLLAFREAVRVGSERLEMDLGLTADNRVVLIHDNSVDRTTDGTGNVRDFPLERLKRLDAGRWKSERFAGERIPTLDEVIDEIPAPTELNLEIKALKIERGEMEATVGAALERIRRRQAGGRVIFSSFSLDALLFVRSLDPDARLLLIDWSDPAEHAGLDAAIEHRLYAWTAPARHATEERVRKAVEAGLITHIGGTAIDESALRYVQWGVHGLSNDDPETLIRFLAENHLRAGDSTAGDTPAGDNPAGDTTANDTRTNDTTAGDRL